jgi:ATP-dependent protease ClpP protease subunit
LTFLLQKTYNWGVIIFLTKSEIVKKLVFITISILMSVPCAADTFTNRSTGEVLHGYATQTMRGGKTLIRSGNEGAAKYIDMANYRVEWSRDGRKNIVIVIPIKEAIELECETAAIEKAIETSSNQGPMFILIEIDTPGGRGDLMKRICNAIAKTDNCLTVAFVSGGEYGGAYSAGAIIALACDQIYMADNTAIGAAMPVVLSEKGVKDLKSAYGATVGEKYLSADRAYVASLAEQNGRPIAIAKAMVDKDIEVVEVSDNGERFFIEPRERKKEQDVIRTWSRRGSLLTLTAGEAVECGIANGLAGSHKEIISALKLDNPRVVPNNEAAKARRAFETAKKKFENLQISIDRYSKEIEICEDKIEAMQFLNTLIKNYEDVIALGRSYPDLAIDEEACKEALNSAKTLLRNIKKLK